MFATVKEEKLKKKNIIILMIIIFVSCSMLILINCYTIKILSGSRAYVNGESHYSKGQKDAVRHLISYLYTEDEEQWKLFKTELDVPKGDGDARIALIENYDIETIKNGFRAGRNHEEDLDDMIWIFKNFKNVSFFNKAIKEWEEADYLIFQIEKTGVEIQEKIATNSLNDKLKKVYLNRLIEFSDILSNKERNFSNILGKGTRQIRDILIYTNIFFTLIIFSSVSFYYNTMFKKLLFSKNELNESNMHLHSVVQDLENIKLDLSNEIVQQKKIIGTISHDIKSPLKYIVLIGKQLCKETKNSNDRLYKYANSMYKSSSQLFEFTNILIEYSNIYIEDKNLKKLRYSFYELVEQKKSLFTEIANNNETTIINKVNKELYSNINNRIIAVIVHNLLDNALKNTIKGTIEIGAQTENKNLRFWVKDSGVGMNHDMIDYYTNLIRKKEPEKLILNNFGIGLHFVLELLILLKGNISFTSKIGEGTTVIVEINH